MTSWPRFCVLIAMRWHQPMWDCLSAIATDQGTASRGDRHARRVSVTWYTWLEQGRPINASVDVSVRVGTAMRLDDAARQHLLTLAMRTPLEPIEPSSTHRMRWCG